MKAVILHGLDGSSTENWLPWLKDELEKLGYEVWVPDLPNADKPDTALWTKFLLSQKWDFSDNLIIGHSAGAVEILALLDALPDKVKVDEAILVAVFSGSLGMESLVKLKDLNFDYGKIKQKAKKILLIESDNDPYVPLDNGIEVAGRLGVEAKVLHGMGHFSASIDPRFDKFPELLDIIKTNTSK